MIKKTLCGISLVCLLAVGGLSGSPARAGGLLKLAHDNKTDPFENPAHACTAVFASMAETDTHGAVKVEVYGSNQLGSPQEHVQLVRDGIIQATLTSTGAMASYYPRIDVLNMPFAYDDYSETYRVFDGKFGKELARDIEDYLGDVVVLGFPDTGGFFAITNSKRAAVTPEEFKGIRIRTMTLPSHQKIIQAMGAEAYPLSWGEVYSALQTGVIDGQMNPVPIISFSKFDEVQKYMTLTNHIFSPYIFLLNRKYYEGLSDDEKSALREAAANCVVASRGLSRIIEASDRGIAGLRKVMKIQALTGDQRQILADLTIPAFEKHIKTNLDEKADELFDVFKTELKNKNSPMYGE